MPRDPKSPYRPAHQHGCTPTHVPVPTSVDIKLNILKEQLEEQISESNQSIQSLTVEITNTKQEITELEISQDAKLAEFKEEIESQIGSGASNLAAELEAVKQDVQKIEEAQTNIWENVTKLSVDGGEITEK